MIADTIAQTPPLIATAAGFAGYVLFALLVTVLAGSVVYDIIADLVTDAEQGAAPHIGHTLLNEFSQVT